MKQAIPPTRPICKDCVHFCPSFSYSSREQRVAWGMCTHPTSRAIDVITGNVTYRYASTARFSEDCGLEGKLYAPETSLVRKVVKNMPSALEIVVFCFWFVVFVGLLPAALFGVS